MGQGMNFLQLQRYIAIAFTELFPESHSSFQDEADRVYQTIRIRLRLTQDERVPFTTKLTDHELQLFTELGTWVDVQTGRTLNRMPTASIPFALKTISQLYLRLPTTENGEIGTTHTKFMLDVTRLFRRLSEKYGISNGYHNTSAGVVFPWDEDQALAELIDEMHIRGVRLEDEPAIDRK